MSSRVRTSLLAALLLVGAAPASRADEPPPTTPPPAAQPAATTAPPAGASEPTEPAPPSSKDKALEYYFEGQSLYQKDLYLQAITAFQRSYELYPANQTLYAIAKCHEKLGMGAKCVSSYQRYLEAYRKDKGKEPPDILDIKNAMAKCKLAVKLEVSIDSEPSGAQVYLGMEDKLVGQTPYKTRLDPGTYTLILKYPGYDKLTKTVELRAGEPQRFVFRLSRPAHAGTIFVAANIARATIYVDGQNVGRTPYEDAITVSAGRHQITVDKEDYAPYTATVDVADGHRVHVRAELWLRDPPSTWKSGVGWTSLVLGALVAGGGVAASFHADTLYRGTPDFDTFQQLQNIGYGAGGGLAGLGLVLLIWEAADTHAVKDGDALEQAAGLTVHPFVTVAAGAGVGGFEVGF